MLLITDTPAIIKKGEGKWIKFEVVDENDVAVDLSSAAISCVLKKNMNETSYIKEWADDDVGWDKTLEGNGIVLCNLPASVTSTMDIRKYKGEFKAVFTSDTDEDLSETFDVKIVHPVHNTT